MLLSSSLVDRVCAVNSIVALSSITILAYKTTRSKPPSPCILPLQRVPHLHIVQLALLMNPLHAPCECPSLCQILGSSTTTLKELFQDVRSLVEDPAAVTLQLQVLSCFVRVVYDFEDIPNDVLKLRVVLKVLLAEILDHFFVKPVFESAKQCNAAPMYSEVVEQDMRFLRRTTSKNSSAAEC